MNLKNTLMLPKPEWSVLLHIDDVPSSGTRSLDLRANDDECDAIAVRAGCESVRDVTAQLQLTLTNGGHILHVAGSVEGEVTQACVVSGAPVTARVQDTFEAWYADYDKAVPFKKAQVEARARLEGDDIPMLDERDDPEPLDAGRVDVGEVALQHFILAIDPYPRAEGVTYDGQTNVAGDDAPPKQLRPNPFAALKNWRPKD